MVDSTPSFNVNFHQFNSIQLSWKTRHQSYSANLILHCFHKRNDSMLNRTRDTTLGDLPKSPDESE